MKNYKIIELRKQNKTYSEIAEITGKSKSTISYICNKYIKNINLNITTENSAKSIYNFNNPEIRKIAREKADTYYQKQHLDAKLKWLEALKKLPDSYVCYIAGLYAGDGRHTTKAFCFYNADKNLIDIFIKFLESINADFYLNLYLHNTHNKQDCLTFWNKKFKYVYQYDKRTQKRNYEKHTNKGTVQIITIKPNGLKSALFEYLETILKTPIQ
jgi:hypothetical protein